MKLRLSRHGTKQLHAVLECEPKESARIYNIVVDKIGAPVYEKSATGKVLYRYHRRHLQELANLFPQAEQSPAVVRQLHQDPVVAVPEGFTVPGYEGAPLNDKQIQGIYKGSRKRRFLLLDDMRVGKTRQALCIAAARGDESFPILIICPNNVKGVWERHIRECFPHWTYEVVTPPHGYEVSMTTDVVICHYEGLRMHAELNEPEWGMVIVDEFHHIKNPDAKQTRAVHELRAKCRVLATGTPTLNGRLEELWGGLHFAWPKRFPSYWAFTLEYCIVKQGMIVGYKPGAVADLRTFVFKHSIRRLNPANIKYRVLEVELTEEQRHLYREIRHENRLWLKDGKKKTVATILAKSTRLKQVCLSPELFGGTTESAKLKMLRELVDELVGQGHKVIVFSQWAKACRIIQRELGAYAEAMAYVDGSVAQAKRDIIRERFQEDPACMVFVGTIGANKEGIPLHAANHTIFTDLEWVPAINQQAAYRMLDYEPKKEPCIVIELRAKNTIEERILKVLQHKQAMNAAFIERDQRGHRIRREIAASIRNLM